MEKRQLGITMVMPRQQSSGYRKSDEDKQTARIQVAEDCGGLQTEGKYKRKSKKNLGR
jgi:hypothetical protein